jgi:hypothetical protein
MIVQHRYSKNKFPRGAAHLIQVNMSSGNQSRQSWEEDRLTFQETALQAASSTLQMVSKGGLCLVMLCQVVFIHAEKRG